MCLDDSLNLVLAKISTSKRSLLWDSRAVFHSISLTKFKIIIQILISFLLSYPWNWIAIRFFCYSLLENVITAINIGITRENKRIPIQASLSKGWKNTNQSCKIVFLSLRIHLFPSFFTITLHCETYVSRGSSCKYLYDVRKKINVKFL